MNYATKIPTITTLGSFMLAPLFLCNDNEDFLQAFEAGLQAYHVDDSQLVSISAIDLMRDIEETLSSEREEPHAWRLGFVAGRIASLCNAHLIYYTTTRVNEETA